MTVTAWENLHRQKRHQLRYPSEHVVRWLAGLQIEVCGKPAALDIGCGSGRHLNLLSVFGYQATGIDLPGDMRSLTFDDDVFDVALSFGVFYYGTRKDHWKALREMHRVLKPGGHGLVVVRTTNDSRCGSGSPGATGLEWMQEFSDEAGMLINFITEGDIAERYRIFSEVSYELTETTRNNRQWRDSDWLIRVVK